MTYVSLVGMTTIPIAAGILAGLSWWMLVPSGLLLALGLDEVRRVVLSATYRGAGPVEARDAGIRLLRPITTCDLAFKRYEVRTGSVPDGRLRVAHVSDLHVNDKLARDYYLAVFELAGRTEPDLLFITGDFVTKAEFIPLLGEILQGARAATGTYGVLGNHDYWVGRAAVAEAVGAAGVTLLGSGSTGVQTGNGVGVVLSGCEDPWGEHAWQPPAVSGAEPVIVLAHTADNIYRLSRAGVTAVFSGHYHGGQGVIPGWGPVIIPSRYGRRFFYGHYVVGETHLFVTSGVGASSPPLRVYCQPELVVVDFVPA
jgi:predicted MPP superfamily phosphohydrolase